MMVIAAGAGAVGLSLAIDLGRRGAKCLLLERHAGTAPWPKMDRTNARSMELFRRIGLADRIGAGRQSDGRLPYAQTQSCRWRSSNFSSVTDCRRNIAKTHDGSLPLEPYQLVSQNKLEPLLKKVAEGTPNVTVCYGHELVTLTQTDSSVTVTKTADGSEPKFSAAYMVAPTADKRGSQDARVRPSGVGSEDWSGDGLSRTATSGLTRSL